MTRVRIAAIVVLAAVAAGSLLPALWSPDTYARQMRDLPDGEPSRKHPLGTDELGRDRLSRLLYGTRVSLLLAPAAALAASILAALIGGAAGFAGGWAQRLVMAGTDLFLSLPWFFLLITVRAAMPLNVSPWTSILVTFALLGCLGWAGAARIVCADAQAICGSDYVILARAAGASGWRLLLRHIVPNLTPVLKAQFWISIPVFILAEANLGMLGLGVAEPLPSWGGLLRELETFPTTVWHPWQLAPLILFVIVVSCFHLAFERQEFQA